MVKNSSFIIHFPSNQSTYSTEPSLNFMGKAIFLPHWCSMRQKKGSDSARQRGRRSGVSLVFNKGNACLKDIKRGTKKGAGCGLFVAYRTLAPDKTEGPPQDCAQQAKGRPDNAIKTR